MNGVRIDSDAAGEFACAAGGEARSGGGSLHQHDSHPAREQVGVDPVGVLAVMSLGATAGSTITVTADGPDAEQAVRTLTEVLSQAE